MGLKASGGFSFVLLPKTPAGHKGHPPVACHETVHVVELEN